MNMAVQPAKPLMSERRVALIGALLVALGPISMAMYSPAMPEIARAFGSTEAAVKMTLSVYFAGFAVAQLICGPLSDGLGRRPVTIGFMLIYFVASIAALISPTIDLLLLARLFQGVGAAVGLSISRAIVRDLFTNEASARTMNTIGLVLAVAPAFSPAIGGLTMAAFGWHAIFVLMALFGVAVVAVTVLAMKETVTRDLSRIRPMAILRAYGTLVSSPYFMTASLVFGGAIGALYTLASILPFILIDHAGLTPTQFGIGMLAQSGLFFCGSLSTRFLMPRFGSYKLVPVGLVFVALGSIAIYFSLTSLPPSFLSVMGPVGIYAFGMGFIMPGMSTASLAPYPHMAGAASSMSGFMQMGSGLVGSVVAAAIGEPVRAMAIVIPAMGATACISWLIWHNLPEPKPPVSLPRP